MNNNIVTKTFWELVHDNRLNISIPIIQRDYVQGRNDRKTEQLRYNFVNDLFDTLHNHIPLNLDFIYGTIENGSFVPLDGQQRLTTLFLLHWYIAVNAQVKSQKYECLSNFKYEIRTSSTDFCKALIEKSEINPSKLDVKLSVAIKNSPWFFGSWKKDQTVLSMLSMLDSIHDKGNNNNYDFIKMWNTLTSNNCPINFEFLNMDEYNLTDQLYIKMNARGKLLTDFEQFKAWFEKHIEKNKIEIDISDWKHKIDTSWTDLLWRLPIKQEQRNIEENSGYSIDNEYLQYFKGILLNYFAINIKHENKANIISDFRSNTYISYSTLEDMKCIDKSIINDLFFLIDFIMDDNRTEKGLLQDIEKKLFIFENEKNTGTYLFYQFIKYGKGNINDIANYSNRTIFHAMQLYIIKLRKYSSQYDDKDKKSFLRWMRICKNLIHNTRIDEPKDFVSALESIEKLASHMDDIYLHLGNLLKNNASISYYSMQGEEEKQKVHLILEDSTNDWEKAFIKYEKHNYFDGQIGFLLEYSMKKDGIFDFKSFLDYVQKAHALYSDKILNHKNNKGENDYLLERALLCKGDYLIEANRNVSFCTNETSLRKKQENWQTVFKDSKKTQYLKKLMNELEIGNEENGLYEIIKNTNELLNWREYFIRNHNVIAFCGRKQVRFHENDEHRIFLLTKQQLNGKYAELRSYSLYVNELIGSSFLPFTNIGYFPISVYPNHNDYDSYACCFIDEWNFQNSNFALDIRYKFVDEMNGFWYHLRFFDRNNKEIPKQISSILNELKFNEEENEYTYIMRSDTTESGVNRTIKKIIDAFKSFI